MSMAGIPKATKKLKLVNEALREELVEKIYTPPDYLSISYLRVRNRELFKELGKMQYDGHVHADETKVPALMASYLRELNANLARIEELKTDEERLIPEREASKQEFSKKKKSINKSIYGK
ncbi:MAG: hypothetical protein E7Z67_02475 [Thermoplasmata archaeon]|nr:hypothetical protein [Thermoplasmata archaeon]